MNESVLIAVEVYFVGFIISMLIASLIKGMQAIIRHISPKSQVTDEGK